MKLLLATFSVIFLFVPGNALPQISFRLRRRHDFV
jgi:hypothetical protein